MRIEFEVTGPLAVELAQAVSETNCSPRRFVREVVENALAERRLPGVRVATQCPEALQALKGKRVRRTGDAPKKQH